MPLYPLKPCPWCKKTPQFYMFIGFQGDLKKTFLPEIKCENFDCKVQPKTKYIPIRKNQRFNPDAIQKKIEKLVSYWNDGNDLTAHEGFAIDFDEVAKMSKNVILD